MILAYFALAPVAAVGFSLGFMPAATAAAVSTLIIGLAAPGPGALTLFMLTSAAPVLVVIYMATRPLPAAEGRPAWFPVDRILGALLLLALGYLVIAMALFANQSGGLQGAISAYLATLFGDLQGLAPDIRDTAIQATALYFPGIALVSWLIMIIVNCILAQKLVAQRGQNLRPTPAYSMIEAPIWPLAVVVVGVLLTFLGGQAMFIGLNLVIVSGIPYILNGYGLLHAASRNWPLRRLVLFVIYLISAMQLWPIAGFGLLGIAETRLRLRKQMNTPKTGPN